MYQKKWVSLFEVLVAIIVFGVWILTIFSLIISNISRVETIKQKNTATMLAKEWLDIVYNLRDMNLERWIDRDCADFDTGTSDNCASHFYLWWTSLYGGSGTDYIIDWNMSNLWSDTYVLNTVSQESDGVLYLHTGNVATTGSAITWFWYNHIAGGDSASLYTRIITFAPSSSYSSNTGNILSITSRVIANVGSKRQEVILESMIWCILGEGDCF